VRRGSISKAVNAHLRRIATEAPCAYRHRPAVKAIAWRAQHRLHGRYRALLARGKTRQKVITAIGRELLGVIWGIGFERERTPLMKESKRAA
jgi:hypothetical protein